MSVNKIYAMYAASSIKQARQDFYVRAVRAAKILAVLGNNTATEYQYGAVDAFQFSAMIRACARHAAKAAGMKTRDLWAVLPDDVLSVIEDNARVSAVVC